MCTSRSRLPAAAPVSGKFTVATLALIVLVSVAPARGAELTGTWQGTITSGGQSEPYAADFSESGYLIYSYRNNRGQVGHAELSAPNQVRFVPPGGGVMTMAVQSVVPRAGGISYTLHTSFERTSQGYLSQEYATDEMDFALTGEGLKIRIVRRAAAFFGDNQPVGGAQTPQILEGILRRAQ